MVGPADEPVVGPADIFADTLLGEAAILQGDAADRKDSGQPAVPRFEDRSYQIEAIAACLAELAAQRRAVLQMACRCGKTRVAHGVICEYLGSPAHRGRPARASRVLFLVPGLALMRQTARKLDRYGFGALGVRLLLVGSDTRPLQGLRCLRAAAPGRGSEDSRTLAGTTNRDLIAAVCGATEPRAALLVIATYQSSPLLPDVFDLTVFDECHRICGARGLRPFNHVLLRHSAGARLFMTATPRLDAPLSMRDRELFGGVAYAYHMRQGIDAGFVNDFSLELVGRAAAGDPPPGKSSSAATRAAKLGTPSQIAAAHDVLAADTPAAKLLVFCRSIRHATGLCRETAALFSARARREGAPRDPRTAAPRCLCAHSRMPRGGVAASLSSFCAPGAPAILFNCRLFQEGVEIPPLNGVFFAAPRHSPRDIIQSLCRPLNAAPGKPASRIFIPVALEPGVPPDAPVNLQRFASIIPYFDALVAEDPLLYEHVLDPRGTPYPLRWVDSAVAARPSGARLRYEPRQLLAAARRSVRRGGAGKTERLLKAARIPWAIGFAELRRIVEECGRYPKTTDCFVYGDAKVNFGQFYRYVRDSYAKWERGEATPLEPHQLRALEALPGWEPYGLQGPYPWAETLSFLEAWLRDHGGVPPMVEINKGGYVGLEATPMERLSGTLTCVNQSDGRDRKSRARAKNGRAARRPGSGLTLDPAKQRDLDALCSRWGLRWRKERHPLPGASAGAPGAGSLVEDEKGAYAGARTFIQEAHARFKQEWARSRRSGAPSAYIARWYPGYPTKHQRQERPDVWARRKEGRPAALARPRGRREDSLRRAHVDLLLRRPAPELKSAFPSHTPDVRKVGAFAEPDLHARGAHFVSSPNSLRPPRPRGRP